MRNVFLTIGLILGLSVLAAQAELVLVDNGFDDYQLGTVHLQGDDGTGSGTSRWAVQQNGQALGDTGTQLVEALPEDATNLAVKLVNRDQNRINHVYTCLSLGDLAIYDEGTIYLRFKADGPNDVNMQSNDLWPHWDYGHLETGDMTAPSFQKGAESNGQMAMFVRLSAGEDFRSIDGTEWSSHRYVDMDQQPNQWQELWIMFDHSEDRCRFYLCPDNGTPVAVPNTFDTVDGVWFHMRNQTRDNNAVMNLRWYAGQYSVGGVLTETNVWIESMAIDPAAHTLARYAGWEPIPGLPPALQADLDGDGDVDLDDFVILKNAFGTGDAGDCDDDGDTDLDDFVILKNEFGSHS
ncbi:MAG: hypothetical protein GX591_07415 [Planctomycetes bacterium]|nr:hypothetical protein [Planctomycetota bacterium]